MNKEENVRCRILNNNDLPAVRQAFCERVLKKFERRIGQYDGYLIFAGDALAGYGWASDKPCKNEGWKPFFFDICPKKGIIYFFDIFIKPEMRGRKLYSTLFNFRIEEARKKGFHKAFYYFNKKNIAMQSFVAKYRFPIVGRITYHRYFWKTSRDLRDLHKICE